MTRIGSHNIGVVPGGGNTYTFPANPGTLALSYPYGAKGYKTTSVQSIPNNTDTTIQLDAEVWDLSNEFNTSTYRFTAATSGYYIVNFSIYFQSINSGSYVRAVVLKNGAIQALVGTAVPGGTNDISVTGGGMIFLNATDYITLQGFQMTGSSKNVYFGEGYTYMSVQRLY